MTDEKTFADLDAIASELEALRAREEKLLDRRYTLLRNARAKKNPPTVARLAAAAHLSEVGVNKELARSKRAADDAAKKAAKTTRRK